MASLRTPFVGPQADATRIMAVAEQQAGELATASMDAVVQDAANPRTPSLTPEELQARLKASAEAAAKESVRAALADNAQPSGFISVQSITNFSLMAPAVNVIYRFLESLDLSGGNRVLEGNFLALWVAAAFGIVLFIVSWGAVPAEKRKDRSVFWGAVGIGILNVFMLAAAAVGIETVTADTAE